MASHIGAPSNKRNYHKLKGGFRTNADSFLNDMMELYGAYVEEVVDGIETETRETARVGMEMLKESSQPAMSQGGTARPMRRRQWKRYCRSWNVLEDSSYNYIHCTIHNKRHYRLTHLLENGHLTRNGTRTRAFEHIKPVEELSVARLLKNIPQIIERGG